MNAHDLRKKIDECIYEVEEMMKHENISHEEIRCKRLVKTKLEESKMWAGKILQAQNSKLPEEFRDECKARTGDVCDTPKQDEIAKDNQPIPEEDCPKAIPEE